MLNSLFSFTGGILADYLETLRRKFREKKPTVFCQAKSLSLFSFFRIYGVFYQEMPGGDSWIFQMWLLCGVLSVQAFFLYFPCLFPNSFSKLSRSVG